MGGSEEDLRGGRGKGTEREKIEKNTGLKHRVIRHMCEDFWKFPNQPRHLSEESHLMSGEIEEQ